MTCFVKQFIKTARLKDSFGIGVVFLVALTVMLPVSLFGIPSGSDLPQHYQFANTYYQSILAGEFFSGWAAHENQGLGGIGIRFYPPLASYVLAVARILTGNWYEASCAAFFFWMLTGCLGIYFWAREHLSPMESAGAAALFAIAPYHLTQLYQFFLYAEFAALAFLPFCFAFLTKVCLRRKPVDVICLAAFYGLLILTHIPTTIVGSISLGLYATFLIDWRKFGETISRLILSVGIALSATAFHWLKIITEIGWLNHLSPQFSSGDYDYRLSFFPIYFSSPDKYFAKVAYLKDFVSIGALIFLLLPLFSFLLWKLTKASDGESKNKSFRGLIFVGLFAFFMSTSLSAFVWEAFAPLQKIQFPFRWLSVVSAIGAVAFIIGAKQLINFSQKLKRAAIYPVLLILLSVTLFDITQIILPSAPYTRDAFEQEINNLVNEKGFDCWWTVWAKQSAFEQTEKVLIENRETNIQNWSATEKALTISPGKTADVNLAVFYYPHWKASVNGQPTEISPAGNGLISFPVPAEKSEVHLRFEERRHIRLAFYISGAAWLIIFSFLSTGFIYSVINYLKGKFFKL